MWTRREFLRTAAASSVAAFAQKPRPNVLLILIDDMGYADIGCFGAKDIRTPHIDRLAREGVKLTDCYSNGPVCTPTRCGLMTGRYQQRFGLEWALGPGVKGYGLRPENNTIARYLQQAGYRTGIFGKWHLGYEENVGPNRHGFDEFYGLLSGNVDHYSHQEINKEADWYENTKPITVEGYSTELLRDRAVQFVEKGDGRPFFLYLPFNSVHWPFQGPGRPQDVRTRPTWFDGTRENDYKPMLESIDSAIGRVVDAIRKKGQLDNTLLIFTNDNGGERLSDNRPFFHHKGTLWEGGIRVPGIVRWPGHIRAGSVSAQPCMSMDLTATIADACGVKPDAAQPFDGTSLLPVLEGKQGVQERTFFWRINRADRKQMACRRGNWKWIHDAGFEQLYDLAKDPGERKDMAYREPKLTAELSGLYAQWEKMLQKNPPPKVIA
ncbi:MAG TPA: sulfatase-like hydrolase/transferase [Bryobacteraceae bacterium]|nr:sulfatase-like hydrolase/transferase [Bryobacteraceae bacterium]